MADKYYKDDDKAHKPDKAPVPADWEGSYNAGQRAAQSAIAREDCPFDPADKLADAWFRGWDRAQGK
jgi:hypothetical protein